MNETLFYFFNGFAGRSDMTDSLIVFGARYLIFVPCIVLGVLALWEYKKGNRVVFLTVAQVLIAGLIAWGAAHLIKFFVFSPRPFLSMDGVRTLFVYGGNDSFPSGHAALSAALAAALFFSHRKLAFSFALAALVIGLSRIVSGIHFPADIAGGYVLGAVVGVLVLRFFSWRR